MQQVGRFVLVLMLAASCGRSSDPSTSDDAATTGDTDTPLDTPLDTTTDTLACTPQGDPGSVLVHGPSGSSSLAATFLVHDATGTVLSRSALMGADTDVSVTVPSCGMVSVVSTDAGVTRVLTWTALQPTNELVHLDRRIPTLSRVFRVHFDAVPDATGYNVFAACSERRFVQTSTTAAGTIDLPVDCPTDAAVFMVAVQAVTPNGQSRTHFAGSLPATNPVIVDLDPPGGVGPGLTANLHHATAFDGGHGSLVGLEARLPGVYCPLGTNTQSLTGDDPALGPTPGINANFEIVEVDVDSADTAPTPTSAVIKHGVVNVFTGPLAVDLASDALPASSGTVDSAASRPTLTWNAARPFDANIAVFELMVGGVTWELVAPPVPGTVHFPQLPADLVAPAPATLASTSLLEATQVTSYAQALTGAVIDTVPQNTRFVRITSSGPGAGAAARRYGVSPR